MRRSALASAVALAFVAAMAWAEATAAAGESAKLAVFAGQWTYQGDVMATTLGPAGKVAGSESIEMLGTSFLVGHYEEKGPSGSSKGVAVYGYDVSKKKPYWMSFDDSGVSASGMWSVSGNEWRMTGTLQLPDKSVEQKCVVVVATDRDSVKARCEVSTDGKAWQVLSDITYAKKK